jgi:hypothetical protein
LVPGQRLEARVILFDSPKALSVANVAIDSDAGKDYVRVREGGDFLRRPIRLGVRGPARSQVLSGLRDGDEVLLAEAGAIETAANTAEPSAETDDPGQATSADGGKTTAAPAPAPQAVRP